METGIFRDRREAGRQLAKTLTRGGYTGKGTLVLGIPRGGLVVADEVAQALSAPLDVIITRKLRAPYQPELGIGAVVDGEHIAIINEGPGTCGGREPRISKPRDCISDQRDRSPLTVLSG
jgi:putative phosphoribosyl transferase